MPGAGWIDAEVQDFPPRYSGWVTVYPQGRSGTPDTRKWQALRVEGASTSVQHLQHLAVLTFPIVLPDHQDTPDGSGNPPQHGKLKTKAECCLEGVSPQKQGKPRD
jgi:hypothetical protein